MERRATSQWGWLLRVLLLLGVACRASAPAVWEYEHSLEDLRRALAAGADPNGVFWARYWQGYVPGAEQSYLSMAASYGRLDLVRELVAAGADVNRADTTCARSIRCDATSPGYGRTPLMYAVSAKSADVVEFLIAHGANLSTETPDGTSALSLAGCETEMVERLLRHGAPVTGSPGKRSALERTFDPPLGIRPEEDLARRCEQVALRLLQAGARLSSLQPAEAQCSAARIGQLELLRALIALYGLPERAATQAVWCAVAPYARGTALPMLVAAGAELDAAGENGETPLIRAASWDGVEAARNLLEQGASVDARGRGGLTALHAAAGQHVRGSRVLELLVTRGAILDARDDAGRTPLFHALSAGNAYAAHLLVAAGADVRARDDAGADLAAARRAGASSTNRARCVRDLQRDLYLPDCTCRDEGTAPCCWFGSEMLCVHERWVSRDAPACSAPEAPTCKPQPSR